MDKNNRASIGLPAKMLKTIGQRRFQIGHSKVNSGINAVTKSSKNQANENAKRGLGLMQNEKVLETDSKDIKKSIGINENAVALIERMFEESNIPKKVVNYEFATFEQLLENNLSFLEEKNNTMKIGSAPEAGGRVYQEPRARYTVNDVNRNMRRVTEDKQKQQRQLIDDAAKIESGTEMTARENVIGITQGATNKYSAGKLLGAQNRARYLDMKEKEMQSERGDNQQEKGR
jgi:hypothetical protein